MAQLIFSLPKIDLSEQYYSADLDANKNYTWMTQLQQAHSPIGYYNGLLSQHDMQLSGMVTNITKHGDTKIIELDTEFNFAEQAPRNASLLLVILTALSVLFALLWSNDLSRVKKTRAERQRVLFK